MALAPASHRDDLSAALGAVVGSPALRTQWLQAVALADRWPEAQTVPSTLLAWLDGLAPPLGYRFESAVAQVVAWGEVHRQCHIKAGDRSSQLQATLMWRIALWYAADPSCWLKRAGIVSVIQV